ncbi:hypothetical protein BC937DRAFT_90685, partial [Endogone sp. FLAS-F59071]
MFTFSDKIARTNKSVEPTVGHPLLVVLLLKSRLVVRVEYARTSLPPGFRPSLYGGSQCRRPCPVKSCSDWAATMIMATANPVFKETRAHLQVCDCLNATPMSEHSPHAAQDVAHSPTALAERAQHKIALNNLTLSGFALLFLGAVYANYNLTVILPRLQPYFSAFFWGAALSIPLVCFLSFDFYTFIQSTTSLTYDIVLIAPFLTTQHLVKTSLVTSLSVALVDENLSFPFLAITVLPRVVVE